MTEGSPLGLRVRGYLVHLYTASGIVPAFLAAAEIASAEPRPAVIFALFALAAVIDATDGPLARRWNVDVHAPGIRGRALDDIVDYLNFTFLPLLLVWRMSWIDPPRALWIVIALIASLLGFANVRAKDEERGVFLGFPSYWNVVAFYVGIFAARDGTVLPTVMIVTLSALTLAPLPFVYPNRAPGGWKWALNLGGIVWLALILATLPSYPLVSPAILWLSLAYPVLHVVASLAMTRGRRRAG